MILHNRKIVETYTLRTEQNPIDEWIVDDPAMPHFELQWRLCLIQIQSYIMETAIHSLRTRLFCFSFSMVYLCVYHQHQAHEHNNPIYFVKQLARRENAYAVRCSEFNY